MQAPGLAIQQLGQQRPCPCCPVGQQEAEPAVTLGGEREAVQRMAVSQCDGQEANRQIYLVHTVVFNGQANK